MSSVTTAAEKIAIDYSKQVAPILNKYCSGCHNDDDREGKLSLESFASMQKGGVSGPAFSAGNPSASLLVRVLTGASEPKMPPEDNEAPTAAEIEVLKQWIETGAKGPAGKEPDRTILNVPKIAPPKNLLSPIVDLSWSPDGQTIATALFKSVVFLNANDLTLKRKLTSFPGKVNSVSYSKDGQSLVTGSGIAGLYGKATLWNAAAGEEVRSFTGHRDIIYSTALSPNNELLATGSYDHEIVVWDVNSGEQIQTFDGHNDAIYDLAFSSDSTVLLSASGDATAKVWHIKSGERLDTLGQPLKDQYTVAISPDGKHLLSAGIDNRIRVWNFVSRENPQTNPLLYARFAHLGPIVNLQFSADGETLLTSSEDKTIKQWETKTYTQTHIYEKQPDIPAALAIAPNGDSFVVGRLDGTLKKYPLFDAKSGKSNSAKAEAALTVVTEERPAAELSEKEPNDEIGQCELIDIPATIIGRIHKTGDKQQYDADMYRFQAQVGEQWVMEVNAARSKSPLDSKVEVLDADGQPILRVQLRALRDSYFTFRGKDSNTNGDFRVFNWEEMELNEYLYANGEVVKLWLYPRGPDSGFNVYPGTGVRHSYFDTTPLAHALQAPCYIVEPHPPGAELIPNGLPVFPLYYENDDESKRRFGKDSMLTFTAPKTGEYFVRVTDVRQFDGEKFDYKLHIRQPKPSFKVTLAGANPKLNRGSGREFRVNVERIDGFDGPIRVDISNLPPGFHASSPVVIQEGQYFAFGTIHALPDAVAPTEENAKTSVVKATAVINGTEITNDVNNLGEIKLADEAAKVLVQVLPDSGELESAGSSPEQPLELTIAPGQTITARVRITRNEFDGRVALGKEDAGRNLPHGIIVDNIGLNGLMVVEGQTERTFFLTAAKWVPEQSRLFSLRATVDGNQSSWPVMLHVRKKESVANNN